MSKNVLIIGCGRLGYFYCMALKNISNKNKINLKCVDINNEALKKIKELETINFQINTFTQIEEIKNSIFDVVIISTCSPGRYDLAIKILEIFEIKNMILEKVIFEKSQQYVDFNQFIKNKSTNIYINLIRRESSFYRENKLKDCNMIITGKNWNLISNISHFIDIFYFINPNLNPEDSNIESNLLQIPQKGREYFNDALGSLIIKNKNKSLIAVSYPGESELDELYISKDVTIKLNEYKVSEIFDSKEKQYQIDPIYVSTIMKDVLSKLFNNEKIFLPKYEDVHKQQKLIYEYFEEKGIKNFT